VDRWVGTKTQKKEGGKSGLDYSLSHSVSPFIPAFTFCHLFYSIFDCLNFNVIVAGNGGQTGDKTLQFFPK
jgi:hypothetical protein